MLRALFLSVLCLFLVFFFVGELKARGASERERELRSEERRLEAELDEIDDRIESERKHCDGRIQSLEEQKGDISKRLEPIRVELEEIRSG